METIVKGYDSPYWKYRKVQVPASSVVEVKPDDFQNLTEYRYRLRHLAFTGAVELGTAPYDTASGGIFRRIQIEVGKSGCSDQNLVPGPLDAFCANPVHQFQKLGAPRPSGHFDLYKPYYLPRDQGLEVQVANIAAASISGGLSFMARGVHRSGQPAILAGRHLGDLGAGNNVDLINADLMNRGREELEIHRLIFGTIANETTVTPEGVELAYFVNPTAGQPWMDAPNPIPVGLLAPECRFGIGGTIAQYDKGPEIYYFPENVYLDREQRLSIKFANVSDADQTVHVVLFGELEVR